MNTITAVLAAQANEKASLQTVRKACDNILNTIDECDREMAAIKFRTTVDYEAGRMCWLALWECEAEKRSYSLLDANRHR